MRKLLCATVLLSLIAVPAMALDFAGKQFYVQGVVTLPQSDFGDVASLGYGAGVGLYVPHTDVLGFRAEVSYLTYSLDDLMPDDASISMIPVLVLAQYNLADKPIYFLGGIGMAFSSADSGIAGTDSESSSDFAVALGAGYQATPMLSIEARYLMISDANQMAGVLGYKF
jgi:opacity protein-like surface antigen